MALLNPIGKSYTVLLAIEPAMARINCPVLPVITKLDELAPVMAEAELFEMVRLFAPNDKVPLVNVNVPDTVAAEVSVTPEVLLMVKLAAPVKPVPVACAAAPL